MFVSFKPTFSWLSALGKHEIWTAGGCGPLLLITGYRYVKSLCGNRYSLKSQASGKKINIQTSRMGAHTEFSCWDSED